VQGVNKVGVGEGALGKEGGGGWGKRGRERSFMLQGAAGEGGKWVGQNREMLTREASRNVYMLTVSPSQGLSPPLPHTVQSGPCT
jgi:hypothetical protein